MQSLTKAFQHLSETQSATKISLINTRVMLETGVNLKQIRPEQDRDLATTEKVFAVLKDMGVA